MKNTEARKILGLDPDDDPRAFLPAFEETREYKQELVNNAPSAAIKFRYQQELLEYEAAVKVVAGKQKIRAHTDFIVVLLLIAAFSAVGWWGYQWYQQQWNTHAQVEVKLAQLQSDGRIAVMGRKWPEAERIYQEIKQLDPGSPVAAAGFEAIKKGRQEEKSQQLFYTLGESQAALEAGRWDEAEKLARSVLEQSPGNETAQRKIEIIREGRRKQEISLKLMAITDAIDAGNLSEARVALAALRESDPENPNLSGFSNRIDAEAKEIRMRHDQAAELYQQALKLDNGEFSPKAMALLEDARRLHPESREILALHQKMGNYTRAINVPVDYPTISQAIEAARPRDFIRVAPGVYKESLTIDKPIRLEGSADGKTIIQLPAKEDGLLTITADADGSHVSGFDFKHTGFDHGLDRYSGITVEADQVTISSCNVEHSAGHGIAVIDGAKVKITGCKVTLCGWDGISVYGQNSTAEVKDTLCRENLQQGVGFWMGGSGSVTNSRLLKNGLCGIVAMSKGTQVRLTSNTCSGNREAGILISDAVAADLASNLCEKNLLSGIVVRSDGTTVSLVNNVTKGNHEAGILTHLGVKVLKFENNRASGNVSQQIWRDANLQKPKKQEE
ncbi:MAG: right-handed parallel beta-helix repeat-containing protein [Akkermansiaceae bacterium]|nr:right-handed parallel beta-helix repeat-containing protein [Akkermansiaceae bacterium]